jgi:hypothetical protein
MRPRLVAVLLAEVLLGAGALLPARAATPRLGLSPRAGALAASPGAPAEETVRVVNLSRGPLDVALSLVELDVDEEGRYLPASAARLPSAVAWSSVSPFTLALPPGNAREVRVRVAPPAGTAPGGYYAALVASPRGGRAEAVHAVLVSVAGAQALRAATIVRVSVPARTFSTRVPVTLALRNTGAVHLGATGRVVLVDALGRERRESLPPGVVVLPGRTRVVRVEVPSPFLPWRVRVRAEVGFGAGVPRDEAAAAGYALAWPGVAAATALLAALASLARAVLRRRSRRRAVPEQVRPAPPGAAPRPGPAPRAWGWRRRLEHAPEPGPRAAAGPAVRRAPPRPDEEASDFWRPKPDAWEPLGLTPDEEFTPADDEEPEALSSTRDEEREEALSSTRDEEREEAPPAAGAEERPVPTVSREGREPPEAGETAGPEEGPEPPLEGARPRAAILPARRALSAGPLTPAAAERRARVALGLLSEGPGRTGERVEVALDVLRTVREATSVAAKVEEAYEAARRARDRKAQAPLALALAAVGSPQAPAALLRAYATAPEPLAGQILEALRELPADALAPHRRLISALPPARRDALRAR